MIDNAIKVSFPSRIYGLNKHTIYVDMINYTENEHSFFKREFPRLAFEHINDLSIGKYITIDFITEPGSMKTFINDDCDNQFKKIFETPIPWDELNDF